MRRWALVLLSALVAVSCVGEVHPGPGAADASTTTSFVTSTTTITSTTIPPTTTLPPWPPVAWEAPNGVPMAVTAANGDLVEVITPCGDPLEMRDGSPIYEISVVIDPGHGGPIDTGAVASTGLPEKEINLRVSLEVGRILNERGIPTMLTRIGDYPVPIRTRSTYADLVGAEALVSIHHNAPAAPASDIPGVEIFVQQDSTDSQRLGGLLYDRTMAALGTFDIDWDRSPDAGVMTVLNPEGRDAYGMVRIPETPSALVELGYIANTAEAELYARPEYAEVAAGAVAEAIERYLTTEDPGAALVEGRVFRPGRGVGRDQCVAVDLEQDLYPSVASVEARETAGSWTLSVTMTSPYDSPERYADAFRVIGDDGVIYGVRELTHDHATEQPFTRTIGGLQIPESVSEITVQGRDLVYGWGGRSVTIELP